MTELSAILTECIDAFDTATDAADVPERIGASVVCSFEVYLTEPDTGGPEVTAHAAILPGGAIAEPYLEASQTATRDIAPGTEVHRALQGRSPSCGTAGTRCPLRLRGRCSLSARRTCSPATWSGVSA